MKTIKLFLAIAALAITSSASAQFANAAKTAPQQSNNSNTVSPRSIPSGDGWGSLYMSIDSPVLVFEGDDDDTFDFDGGFTVGYSSVEPLQGNLPLFLECGVEASYSYISEEDEEDYYSWKESMSYLNLAIPVNVIYEYALNDMITLAPYAGLSAKYGLSFKEKYEVEYDGDTESEEYSLYDEDEMGDYALTRFLFGCQYGLNIHIQNKYIVGIKWQNDITEISKEEELKFKNSAAITLGIRF